MKKTIFLLMAMTISKIAMATSMIMPSLNPGISNINGRFREFNNIPADRLYERDNSYFLKGSNTLSEISKLSGIERINALSEFDKVISREELNKSLDLISMRNFEGEGLTENEMIGNILTDLRDNLGEEKLLKLMSHEELKQLELFSKMDLEEIRDNPYFNKCWQAAAGGAAAAVVEYVWDRVVGRFKTMDPIVDPDYFDIYPNTVGPEANWKAAAVVAPLAYKASEWALKKVFGKPNSMEEGEVPEGYFDINPGARSGRPIEGARPGRATMLPAGPNRSFEAEENGNSEIFDVPTNF